MAAASATSPGGGTGRRPPDARRRATSSRVPPERRARTVRRIVAFFRPYRFQVVVVLVAILATSLIGLVNPYLLKLLIDDVIVGGQYDQPQPLRRPDDRRCRS